MTACERLGCIESENSGIIEDKMLLHILIKDSLKERNEI